MNLECDYNSKHEQSRIPQVVWSLVPNTNAKGQACKQLGQWTHELDYNNI